MLNRFHKKERIKSSKEVQNKVATYDNGNKFISTRVTTENSSSSEVSMDMPQSTYMHLPFSPHSKFSQDDYYFFGKCIKYDTIF